MALYVPAPMQALATRELQMVLTYIFGISIGVSHRHRCTLLHFRVNPPSDTVAKDSETAGVTFVIVQLPICGESDAGSSFNKEFSRRSRILGANDYIIKCFVFGIDIDT